MVVWRWSGGERMSSVLSESEEKRRKYLVTIVLCIYHVLGFPRGGNPNFIFDFVGFVVEKRVFLPLSLSLSLSRMDMDMDIIAAAFTCSRVFHVYFTVQVLGSRFFSSLPVLYRPPLPLGLLLYNKYLSLHTYQAAILRKNKRLQIPHFSRLRASRIDMVSPFCVSPLFIFQANVYFLNL